MCGFVDVVDPKGRWGLMDERMMNDEHFLQGPSGLDLELVEVLQGLLGLDLGGGFHEERRGLLDPSGFA